MKKELLAIVLLLALIAASAVNLHHINSLTGEVLDTLEASEQALLSGDDAGALEFWQMAFDVWESSYSYSHIFIRHQEIDSSAEDFYSLKEKILSGEADAANAAYGMLRYRLECIASMEKPALGTIF